MMIFWFLVLSLVFPMLKADSWCRTNWKSGSGQVTEVAYAHAGNRVAYITTDNNYIKVLQANTFNSAGTYNATSHTALSLLFAQTGNELYVGYNEGSLVILTISTNPFGVQTITSGHTSIEDIDANEDFTKFVTCGGDEIFRVWDSSWSLLYTSHAVGY